eukprot:g10594.t1
MDVINTQRATLNASSKRLEQHSNGDVTGLAASKLEAYRRNSGAMRTYNDATRQLLSPTRQAPQQPVSRLRAPQQGRFASAAPMRGTTTDSNGVPAMTSNGGGEAYSGSALCESTGVDANWEETVGKLNKAIRQKNATIQEKNQELLRYKTLVESFNNTVEDINYDSMTTNQRIEELADDLAVEKRNHEAARQSLEAKTHEAEVARRSLEDQSASLHAKTREVEQHSLRLAEMERASAIAHEQNLELSRRIQELNRLADEQEAAAAAPQEEDGEGGGERRKEVEKLQQAVEMKTRQLEAVKERANKTSMELQYLKGQARSGRFKSLLLNFWWLLRTVGLLGFLLFVYVAVSEDAFRSRGVDVYRLAH